MKKNMILKAGFCLFNLTIVLYAIISLHSIPHLIGGILILLINPFTVLGIIIISFGEVFTYASKVKEENDLTV
jgi:Protein of unknown function (DUF2975)